MINRKDIIENLAERQGVYQVPILVTASQKRMYSRVISLYLKFMFDSILQGYKWHISRMGNFELITVPTDQNRLKPFVNYYRDGKIRRNKRVFNPKMAGETVKLHVESEFLEQEKCRFRPPKLFRDRLTKRLFEEGNYLKDVDKQINYNQ